MNMQLADFNYRELFLSDCAPSVLIDSATGRIREVNRAFEELAAAGHDQLVGRPIDEIIERVGSYGRAQGGTAAPLEVESYEVASWTLLRLHQETAQTSRHQFSAFAQMAAGVAHDFNNVLMAVLPWADILRRTYRDDEKIQEATEHIRRAVFRARDLTAEVLGFAQPEPPKKTLIDLAALVSDQVARVSSVCDRVTFEPFDDEILINADGGQLAEVLHHVLTNARLAIREKGSIHVTVRRVDADRQIEKGLFPGHPFAKIEVKDTGEGMTMDVLHRAFDPFFTTRNDAKGLGLSVSLQKVERHGGIIRIESRPAEETIVHIFLPGLEPGTAELAAGPPHLRLLVIDDDSSVSEGIKAILELGGSEVTLTPGGVEALAIIDDGFRPDGIVLDLGMPGMRGGQVHRLLRERLPVTPIVISSGWTAGAEATELLQDERTRLLQKPYDPEQLLIEFSRLF